MFKRLMALIVAASMATGCATSGRTRFAMGQRVASADAPRQPMDRALLSEYVQKLPLGSRVRVDKVDGRAVRGTLIKAGDQALVVQPRTRVPEPPIEVAFADIVAVTPEGRNGGVGTAVGVGLLAGLGGTLLAFLILAAIYND